MDNFCNMKEEQEDLKETELPRNEKKYWSWN